MRRRHILLTAVVVAGALTQDAAAAWRPPVAGPLTSTFDYNRGAPFQRGARRGIRFDAESGSAVRAACPGIVRYAGSAPGGDVVTVRCGELVATHLGLATVSVSAGTRVKAGSRIGTSGSSGVGLGARRIGDRWGYVDPAELLASSAPDLGPPPSPPPPVARPRGRPAPVRHPARLPGSRRVAAAPPLVAWVGLALVAATLAGVTGGTVRRRWGPSTSRRRSTTSMPRRT
jgi:Peptidase family M23